MTKPHTQAKQGSDRPAQSAHQEDMLPLEQGMKPVVKKDTALVTTLDNVADIKNDCSTVTVNSKLHLLSQDWSWHTLKSLGEILTGRTPPTATEGELINLIPFITPAEIDGSFNRKFL